MKYEPGTRITDKMLFEVFRIYIFTKIIKISERNLLINLKK